jgi:hypothetical protein
MNSWVPKSTPYAAAWRQNAGSLTTDGAKTGCSPQAFCRGAQAGRLTTLLMMRQLAACVSHQRRLHAWHQLISCAPLIRLLTLMVPVRPLGKKPLHSEDTMDENSFQGTSWLLQHVQRCSAHGASVAEQEHGGQRSGADAGRDSPLGRAAQVHDAQHLAGGAAEGHRVGCTAAHTDTSEGSKHGHCQQLCNCSAIQLSMAAAMPSRCPHSSKQGRCGDDGAGRTGSHQEKQDVARVDSRTVGGHDVGAAVAGGLQALVLAAAHLAAQAGYGPRDVQHLRGGASAVLQPQPARPQVCRRGKT